MKERQRGAELMREIVARIDNAIVGEGLDSSSRIRVLPREQVATYANQIVVTYLDHEYTITLTENRKSRLK